MTHDQAAAGAYTVAAAAHETASAAHQAVNEGQGSPAQATDTTAEARSSTVAASQATAIAIGECNGLSVVRFADWAEGESADATTLVVQLDHDRAEIAAAHRRAADAHRRAACEHHSVERS
jgi:uncharacterized protein YukE